MLLLDITLLPYCDWSSYHGCWRWMHASADCSWRLTCHSEDSSFLLTEIPFRVAGLRCRSTIGSMLGSPSSSSTSSRTATPTLFASSMTSTGPWRHIRASQHSGLSPAAVVESWSWRTTIQDYCLRGDAKLSPLFYVRSKMFSSKCNPVRNDRVWHYTHTCVVWRRGESKMIIADEC